MRDRLVGSRAGGPTGAAGRSRARNPSGDVARGEGDSPQPEGDAQRRHDDGQRRDAERRGHDMSSMEPEDMAALGADVVEPPVLGDPPSSPWSDGFGRTAVRSVQILMVAALTVAGVYAAVQLRLVIIPLLVAVLLAAALSPVVSRLTARGLGRGVATLLTLLAAVVVLGLVGWFVVNGVIGSLPELQRSATEGVGQLRQFIDEGPLNISDQQVEDAQASALSVLQGESVRSGALAGASLVGTILTGLILGLVVLIYLLKDGPSIFSFLISGSKGARHTRLQHAGERAGTVLGGYVRGTTVVALVDAVLIGGGLLALGVPLALPLALVVFLTAYIPVIGAVVAGVVAALVTLVTNGPTDALIVIVIVLIVNQIEGNILAPLVLGKALSLHPLAILLALTAGTIVAGIIGAVLAVPFAAVAWAAVKSWNEDRRSSDDLLTAGGSPLSTPPGQAQVGVAAGSRQAAARS